MEGEWLAYPPRLSAKLVRRSCLTWVYLVVVGVVLTIVFTLAEEQETVEM